MMKINANSTMKLALIFIILLYITTAVTAQPHLY